MSTRYRLTLTKLLGKGRITDIHHDFEIHEKFEENHLLTMSRDALPSMVNHIVSTKGFIAEDRFTPEWNGIASELREIHKRHPGGKVMILSVDEIDELIAKLAGDGEGDCRDNETDRQHAEMVRAFFYGVSP